MKLVYEGPHDAVRVSLPGGGEATVKRGEVFDCMDSLGRELRKQPTWTEHKPKPAPVGKEDE